MRNKFFNPQIDEALKRWSKDNPGDWKYNELHGLSRTKTYQAWNDMKRRCYDKNNVSFKYYGLKGITVCNRWRYSFSKFYEDMGECPPGYSLDRIDNTKGYYPENCRWVSMEEQYKNRRGRRTANEIRIERESGMSTLQVIMK